MSKDTITVQQSNPKTGQSEQRTYRIGQPVTKYPAKSPKTYQFDLYPIAADERPGLPPVTENGIYESDKGFTNRVTVEVTVEPRPQNEGPEEQIARAAIPSALRNQVPPDLGGPQEFKVRI